MQFVFVLIKKEKEINRFHGSALLSSSYVQFISRASVFNDLDLDIPFLKTSSLFSRFAMVAIMWKGN